MLIPWWSCINIRRMPVFYHSAENQKCLGLAINIHGGTTYNSPGNWHVDAVVAKALDDFFGEPLLAAAAAPFPPAWRSLPPFSSGLCSSVKHLTLIGVDMQEVQAACAWATVRESPWSICSALFLSPESSPIYFCSCLCQIGKGPNDIRFLCVT